MSAGKARGNGRSCESEHVRCSFRIFIDRVDRESRRENDSRKNGWIKAAGHVRMAEDGNLGQIAAEFQSNLSPR